MKTLESSIQSFEGIPIIEGPLSRLEHLRPTILTDVASRTSGEFENSELESSISEAFFYEKQRLRREKFNPFTRVRIAKDKALWSEVGQALRRAPAEVDRREILGKIIKHYGQEIGGHFDLDIYKFAVEAVPWGFNWLLNAATVKKFIPGKFKENLSSQLQVRGEIEALQKLSKKGTILLVPTHQSNIDSVLIGYVIYLMQLPPFCYGAGLNLFSNPVLSFFMSRLGAYTVDRKKTNDIYKYTLKNYSTQILQQGVHSIFFPGGGRSRSGALESKLKLGLLGTGIEAQINATRAGLPNPNVYVVPVITSYHFVLEASSLIEDFLAEKGGHRFFSSHEEIFSPTKFFGFFWKLFTSRAGITVRIGKALDVFGNYVDEEGFSQGPNGTIISPEKWLTTRGKFEAVPERDREYTRRLGEKLIERYHADNTVLSSHIVAFAFFERLREQYPDYDLFRFLRISSAQRTLFYTDFMKKVEQVWEDVKGLERRGELVLSSELSNQSLESWVRSGVSQLGLFHDSRTLVIDNISVFTEDMQQLYYYRNRLAGYGLSLLAGEKGSLRKPGQHDSKGFLA